MATAPSEVLGNRGLPDGWTIKRLGSALPLEYGKALPARSRTNSGETKVYGSSGPVGEHSTRFLEGPAIIVGRKGSAGAVHYSSGPCWPIDTAYYVRLTDQIDPRYAFHLLSALRLDQLDQSTAIPSLSRDTYGAIEAPFPDLATQRRVAARIDELFAEIDDGEEELRRARQELGTYRRSLLKSAVTGELTADWRTSNVPDETGEQLLTRILDERHARWAADPKNKGRRYSAPRPPKTEGLPKLPPTWTWATIHQLTDFLTSGSRGWSQYYSSAGATFIRAQNIKTDRLNLSDVAYVHLPAKAEGTRTRVRVGDILVTITGANVTKAAIVESDVGEAYVSQHVALLRLHPAISSHFCWLWLVTPAGGRRQLERAAYGAGKPGLNLPNILDVTIPLPPLSEQEQVFELAQTALNNVADLVGDMPRLIDVGELRQSILAAAFHGELVR